jgi:hypothetical protein
MLVRFVTAAAFGIAGALPGTVLLLRYDGVWPGLSVAEGDALWCVQLPAAAAAACGFVAGPHLTGAPASSARVTAVSLMIGVVAVAAAFAGHGYGTQGARYVFDPELLRTSWPLGRQGWQDLARTGRVLLALHPVVSVVAGWILSTSTDRILGAWRQAGLLLARAGRGVGEGARTAETWLGDPRVAVAVAFATGSAVSTLLTLLFIAPALVFSRYWMVALWPPLFAAAWGYTVGFHSLKKATSPRQAVARGMRMLALAFPAYLVFEYAAMLVPWALLRSTGAFLYVATMLMLWPPYLVSVLLGHAVTGALAGRLLYPRLVRASGPLT